MSYTSGIRKKMPRIRRKMHDAIIASNPYSSISQFILDVLGLVS